MNKRILLLAAIAVGLSSCSTLYRSGQTPDDVYYSPSPQQRVAYSDNDPYYDSNSGDEYVNVQTEQDRSAYQSEDNYLRMKVRNRALWSGLDDYGYYGGGMYSPYFGSSFGLGYGYSPYSFYSPYSMYSPYSLYSPYYSSFGMGLGFGWGGLYGGYYNPYSFYSPFYDPYYSYGYGHYYPGIISGKPIGNMKPAGTYTPRTSNLRSFGNQRSNTNLNNNNGNAPVRVFRNNNNNNYVNPRSSSPSNTSPRRSVERDTQSRPSRTFDNNNSPSTPRFSPGSNSGSRMGGSGGSAPSRSPGRGGR